MLGITAHNRRWIFLVPVLLALHGSGQDILTGPGSYASIEPDLVKNINPGHQGSDITNLCASNGRVYFSADDSTTTNDRLWVSDGTEAGTIPLINYGKTPPFDAIIPLGTSTTFRTATAVGQVFTTANGSAPQPLGMLLPPPSFSMSATRNNVLYFPAGRDKLWNWSFTLAGQRPSLLTTMPAPVAGTAATFGKMVALNSSVIFPYASATNGSELFINNGLPGAAATTLIKDEIVGTVGSKPTNLTVYNGKVYYQAAVGTAANTELCRTDGTAAGTGLFKQINSSATVGSAPADLTVFNNKLYFTANDGQGRRLWVTDGTAAGTIKLEPNSVVDPKVADLIVVNGTLYFTADPNGVGRVFWSTDGVASPTASPWSPVMSAVHRVAVCHDKLVFFVSLSANSPTYTSILIVDPKEASPAPRSVTMGVVTKQVLFSGAPQLAVVGNRIYFRANRNNLGEELWKLDL